MVYNLSYNKKKDQNKSWLISSYISIKIKMLFLTHIQSSHNKVVE